MTSAWIAFEMMATHEQRERKKMRIKCEKNWIKLMDKRIQTEFESSFFPHQLFHSVFFSSFFSCCINNLLPRWLWWRWIMADGNRKNHALTGQIEGLNNWLLAGSFEGCASIREYHGFADHFRATFKVFLLILHLAFRLPGTKSC